MRRLTALFCAILLVFSLFLPAVRAEDGLRQLEEALMDDAREVEVADSFRIAVDAGDLSAVQGLDPDWENILILGTDTGNAQLNYGRTDAMMVLSVNTRTGELKLTSLVRDMLVDIPGLNNQNRINTANAFGGPLLAMKTVNQVLGLNIARYASINFGGFVRVIDHLGGVSLVLSPGEAGIIGLSGSDEARLLNGKQALEYVRIRSLDSNFGRNERQRKLLIALLAQVKEKDMSEVMDAAAEVLALVATNLTTAELMPLLLAALKGGGQIAPLSLPAEGQYRLTQTDSGASVVAFDAEAVRQSFHQFVYGQEAPAASK